MNKWTEKEIQKLLRLGNMRFWSLLRREVIHSKKKMEGNDGIPQG